MKVTSAMVSADDEVGVRVNVEMTQHHDTERQTHLPINGGLTDPLHCHACVGADVHGKVG